MASTLSSLTTPTPTTQSFFPSSSSRFLHFSNFTSKSFPNLNRPFTRLHVSSSSPTTTTTTNKEETIFFDGGAHYGDLLANLVLGFTLVWLPLTIAAVSRAFFLRYRFTNLRVTVISGLTGEDRSDFSYEVIKDVQVVPRFIGEWGDIIITLKDGTKVDLRSVPKFRQIAKYCLSLRASQNPDFLNQTPPKGF
ncbi:hypothetical protein CsatB_009935 [Cannabis sativa]|uniref:YdbS-like PH domain-containing protein n=1 Tax=Cannabis sativa TaxID=3483 RepID=A0A7J6H1Q8_CANSA|nr:hypothetical protein F8388_026680 [Cannabis sativa]